MNASTLEVLAYLLPHGAKKMASGAIVATLNFFATTRITQKMRDIFRAATSVVITVAYNDPGDKYPYSYTVHNYGHVDVEKKRNILEKRAGTEYYSHEVTDLVILKTISKKVKTKNIANLRNDVDVFDHLSTQPSVEVPVAVKWKGTNMYYIGTATTTETITSRDVAIGSEHQAVIPRISLFDRIKSKGLRVLGISDPREGRPIPLEEVEAELHGGSDFYGPDFSEVV